MEKSQNIRDITADKIDTNRITNPLVRRVLENLIVNVGGGFIFRKGGSHRDYTERVHTDYSEHTERVHTDWGETEPGQKHMDYYS